MDPIVPVLFFYFVLAMAVVVPLQALKLRAQAQMRVRPINLPALIWFSLFSVASGLVIGFGVGYAVMFGPSYITGDFIGMPWLTMLPALGLGLWAGTKANSAVLSMLFARAERSSERT